MNIQNNIDQAFELIQEGDFLAAKAICMFLGKSQDTVVDAQFLLGVIAFKENQNIDAINLLSIAIEARPNVPEYYKILGDVFQADRKTEEAISAYRQGYKVSPGNIQIGMNLARALRSGGEESEALNVVKEISSRHGKPTFAATLASWRLSYVPSSEEQMADLRRDYEQAVNALKNIDGLTDEELLLYTATNFLAAYQGVDDRIFQEVIADFYMRTCPDLMYRAPHIDQSAGKKFRIGFVSENFRNHTVGLLYQGLIAQFNQRDWEVYVYASSHVDEVTRHIRSNCHIFRILPVHLRDARNSIAADRLDVIYFADIGMNPLTYYLAFARLARVQCVGWGHPVTTGIPSIDFFVSSKHLETADTNAANSRYTEKLILLNSPPTYLYPFDEGIVDKDSVKPVTNDQTLYFCPQTLYKIHPDFDQIIINILQRDPTGVAVFIEGQHNWSEALRKRWNVIDAKTSRRIKFIQRMDKKSFLSMLAMTDVILDTIYFSGGITSAEALYLGTPVITFAGTPFMAGRVTYAYYQQLGVLDCVAETLSAYVDIAVKMGTDKIWRDSVSASIKSRRHLLFEQQQIIDQLEEFLLSRLTLA